MKWQCDLCYEAFYLKKDLIDHVYAEWEEAAQDEDITHAQLEELGVKKFVY